MPATFYFWIIAQFDIAPLLCYVYCLHYSRCLRFKMFIAKNDTIAHIANKSFHSGKNLSKIKNKLDSSSLTQTDMYLTFSLDIQRQQTQKHTIFTNPHANHVCSLDAEEGKPAASHSSRT